jgi:hypothetical protein
MSYRYEEDYEPRDEDYGRDERRPGEEYERQQRGQYSQLSYQQQQQQQQQPPRGGYGAGEGEGGYTQQPPSGYGGYGPNYGGNLPTLIIR